MLRLHPSLRTKDEASKMPTKHLFLLSGLVVLLAITLIAKELGVHALGGGQNLLLRLLDAVLVVLVALVVGCVILGLRHCIGIGCAAVC